MKLTQPVCLFFMMASISLGQSNGPAWDSKEHGTWGEAFELVSIPSSKDGKAQKAYVHKSTGDSPRPLLVSLHTWGGKFSQVDPLAQLAVAANWNYIHPDFRGPNVSPEACLSPLVISDVDDAVSSMLGQGKVDEKNVFLVGVSGGAHVACGMLLKSTHSFRRILAWAPITDLVKWYEECSQKPNRLNYVKDILACAGNADGQLNSQEAKARSPMWMEFPSTPPSGIDIYEGIDDGWKGNVPISHSIRFYNRLADQDGASAAKVTGPEMDGLCKRTFVSKDNLGQLGDRKILFQRDFTQATLTIFQGGHEMLPQVCFEKIQAMSNENP
jgi:pimeloyl-ACP methyl ester carboxylesterase